MTRTDRYAIREAELIGTLVSFAGACDDVPPQLEPGDFTVRELGICWAAIKARHARGQSTDVVSVHADLPEPAAGVLEAAAAIASTSAHVQAHAEAIIELAATRRLLTTLQQLQPASLDQLLSDVTSATATASERTAFVADDSLFTTTEQRMARLIASSEAAMRGENRGHKTGIGAIDKITAGIRRGATWIVGARPGVGKSALAMQLAAKVASDGRHAMFVSVEMSVLEIATREASSAAGINSTKIADGRLTDEDWQRLTRRAGELSYRQGDRLAVTDRLGSDAEKIIHAARRRHRQGKLDVLVVDYLQRLYAPRAVGRDTNRNGELEKITNMFADFARETNTSVILPSQLKRIRGAEPGLDDLRDSGGIEASADVVMLMHQDAGDEEQTLERKLIVAKNRQGPPGVAYVVLDPARMMFAPIIPGGPA